MKKINWKSIVGWGIAALVAIGIIGINIHSTQKAHEGKFVVAVNVPLSGPFAQAFKSGFFAFKSGIEDELKAQGIPLDSVYIDEGDIN